MDLGVFKEMESKYHPHWAVKLESGDRIKVTLRHPTDGSLNKHNVDAIVISVDKAANKVECHTEHGIYKVPFNETAKG